jgi:hypothetical protein
MYSICSITDIEIVLIPKTCDVLQPTDLYPLSYDSKTFDKTLFSLFSTLLSKVRETCFEDKLTFIELNL